MPRLFIFAAFALLIFFVVKWLRAASGSDEKCSRCEGRGFWYGTRGRERCDWCKGSGRLPKGLQ